MKQYTYIRYTLIMTTAYKLWANKTNSIQQRSWQSNRASVGH